MAFLAYRQSTFSPTSWNPWILTSTVSAQLPSPHHQETSAPSHKRGYKNGRKPMQKFIFYLNSKNLKLLSNSGKYHNAEPQGEASYTETDKLNAYTADKPRRGVDYIFTARDAF